MKIKNCGKILALILTFALCASLFAFVACDNSSEAEAASVMTVSLNPEVEFVLDSNNKVLAVNALNDEGNLVISAEAFENVEGKSAEEAATLFVRVATETGYLVSGSVEADENKIEFSFSVDTEAATALYEKIETSVTDYLSEAEVAVTANLEKAEAIARSELEEKVAECRPDLTESEIQAMTEKQLLAEILESRKATAEIYSQELKDAYYDAKAYALEQAKLEVVKGKLSTLQQSVLTAADEIYTQAYQTLEETRNRFLISSDSAYQQALAEVREKKTEYLKVRNEIAQMEQNEVTEAETARLNACVTALETAETALEKAKEAAETLIDSAQDALDTAYTTIVNAISGVDLDEISAEISESQTKAISEFTTSFETTYKTAAETAEQNWQTMIDNLKSND